MMIVAARMQNVHVISMALVSFHTFHIAENFSKARCLATGEKDFYSMNFVCFLYTEKSSVVSNLYTWF